jgi:hypothetical protein
LSPSKYFKIPKTKEYSYGEKKLERVLEVKGN